MNAATPQTTSILSSSTPVTTYVYSLRIENEDRYIGAAANPHRQTQRNFFKAKHGTKGAVFDVLRELLIREIPYEIVHLELVTSEGRKDAKARAALWRQQLLPIVLDEATCTPRFYASPRPYHYLPNRIRTKKDRYHTQLLADLRNYFPKPIHKTTEWKNPRRQNSSQTHPNPLNL